MTKNVNVTDAQGNIIGTTYPKRAKGLIKNGRAIFVDDCTIRLSEKSEPSDTNTNISEVNQMNYIFFNPRNWSFEQAQYNNQNSFGFSHTYQNGWNHAVQQPVRAERSFISDFDGGLVESLMFGDWDTPYVRTVSNELSLTPDTDYCFVFWLNGGENDRNNETCQLQMAFWGNWENCYTYKLNRNYIKPLLHKEGWELYSIPFHTPEVSYTPQGTSEPAPTAATRFAFVAGNAPMAIKPAKEPEAYADWEDAPDEFAAVRPQRHNLVFADGWPSISQYGGDKYSTEALRAKKTIEEAIKSNRFSDIFHNATENFGNATQNATEGIRNAMQNMAEKARRMAENYKSSGSVNWRNAEDSTDTTNVPPISTLADNLAEHLDEIEMQRDDLTDYVNSLRARFTELSGRVEAMTAQDLLTADALAGLTGRLSSFENELHCLETRVSELDTQVDGADIEIEMRGMSSDEGDAYLDSLESQLDAEDSHADGMEESLDSLEEYLDNLEEATEKD